MISLLIALCFALLGVPTLCFYYRIPYSFSQELPPEMLKALKKAGIPEADAANNLMVVLNMLHFHTKVGDTRAPPTFY